MSWAELRLRPAVTVSQVYQKVSQVSHVLPGKGCLRFAAQGLPLTLDIKVIDFIDDKTATSDKKHYVNFWG